MAEPELSTTLLQVRGGERPRPELELCVQCGRHTVWASATVLVCPACLLRAFERVRGAALDLLIPYAADPDSPGDKLKRFRSTLRAEPPIWEVK